MKPIILAISFGLSLLIPANAQVITSQTVDTGTFGRVGRNTSQAVIAGNPSMIYSDLVKNHLMFARNTAADGSGSWIKTKITSYGTLGAADSHVLKTVAGNPAVAFSDGEGLKFARCSTADGSGTWTVYSTGLNSSCPNLEVVDGKPALTAIGENGELIFALCSTSDGSGTWTTVTVDSADVSNAVSMAVVAGKPAIIYWTNTTFVEANFEGGGYYLGDLRYATCATTDGLGAWTHHVVEADVNAGGQISLAEVDGKPAAACSDVEDYDLIYARSESVDGSGSWILTSVDATGTTGAYPSLVVVDGEPAIAYQYGTGSDLRYARNDLADGSGTWTVTNVHTVGVTGSWASLAVVDGKPAVSFHYSTGYDLMWARNAAADGSGAWTVTTADNAANSGRVGQFSRTAIVAGKPVAVYQDTWWDRQKFAAAGTADGVGPWTSQTPAFTSNSLSESIAEVDGRPALVYKDGSTGHPKFSINANPDGSGAWTTTTLATSSTYGVRLATIGGYPAVLNRNFTQEIFFLRNSALNATGTWVTSSTGISATVISDPVEVVGTPAFCAVNTAYEITFTRNTAANGTGTWETSVVDPTPTPGYYHQDPELAVIDGKPAVFFVKTDNTGASVRLATNSQADGSGAWSISTILTGLPDWQITSGFAAGNPAFTWFNDTHHDLIGNLMLTRNTAADGSGTWLTYTLDRDRAGDNGSFVTIGTKTGITFYDYLNRNFEYLLVDTAASAISVEQPATYVLDAAHASVAFESVTITRPAPVKSITIRNTGASDLTVSAISIDGTHAAEFVPDSTTPFTLVPGATHILNLTFTPADVGMRAATLHLASSDAAQPLFHVNLSGEGLPYNEMETWRLEWFGTSENTGNAALSADPDNDGTTNLYEFAYGLNPTATDAPPKPQMALHNGNIELTYIRGSRAPGDLSFRVPWTETLNGSDWTYGDEIEEILSDNGTQQTVKAILPMGAAGRRFVRLEIESYY
jgi:hypothetical protein